MAAEFWHVLNRGVEKRDIVMDDRDRARFIHDLYVMNDANIVQHIYQPQRQGPLSYSRRQLVRIHAFCLMNNHYHLLLSPISEGGISAFMQKFNMGYSKYFNERYKRTGVLWQGKHKKIRIERDAHFMYVPYYIHLNPLDYGMRSWREGRVPDVNAALKKLRAYRWSSHFDYLGVRNFPSVIDKSELADLFGKSARYERGLTDIITSRTLASRSTAIE